MTDEYDSSQYQSIPLVERLEGLGIASADEAAARIRELEAAQGEGMYGEYTSITVRSDTAPVTVTVSEAARVLLHAMTTGDLIDERIVGLFYDCQPLAALRALAGQGGEA